jgi:hypothetical protein
MANKNGITLTEEEFKTLDQMIGKLPTSYGMNFVDFFRLITQKRKQEELLEKQQLEKKPNNT